MTQLFWHARGQTFIAVLMVLGIEHRCRVVPSVDGNYTLTIRTKNKQVYSVTYNTARKCTNRAAEYLQELEQGLHQ